MKILLAVCAIIGITNGIFSQPFNGSYTIGGSTPDFVTLQEAANALKLSGVSGPVFFNIRPGVYTKDGGANTVLIIDSTIAGVSETNRITFQPDESAGGNVDNVILQADFNGSSTQRILAKINADFITIRKLTFQDVDSLDTPAFSLLNAQPGNFNIIVDGLEIDGCKFIGTPYFSTDFGISSNQNVSSAFVKNCRFYRLLRAISFENGVSRAGSIIVEDNEFYQGYRGQTGSGNPLGKAIELACSYASVKRNIIDYTGSSNGGFMGIEVAFTSVAFIERNFIKNNPGISGEFRAINSRAYLPSFSVDSIIISNNMITSNYGPQVFAIGCNSPNTKLLFNTIVNPNTQGAFTGLLITGDNCTVLNNIFINNNTNTSNFSILYDQGNQNQSQNLISDYNIFFMHAGGSQHLVYKGGQFYNSLTDYQIELGKDLNTIMKEVEFIAPDDAHLTDCQAQDPEMVGIPVPGITEDIDGETRNTIKPFRGADENTAVIQQLFNGHFTIENTGAAFSVGVGLLENIVANGLAVPQRENDIIRVFDYSDPRNYNLTAELPTPFKPSAVRIAKMDNDQIGDIVIGCDTDTIAVIFYNVISSVIISIPTTPHRVRSIEVADINLDGTNDIIATQDDGFVSTTGNLAVYLNNGNQFFTPQMIDDETDVRLDLLVQDLDNDNDQDVVVMNLVFPSSISVYINRGGAGSNWLGFEPEVKYLYGTHAVQESGIAPGDFDNDGDIDLMISSVLDSLVFLLNNGDATFILRRVSAGFQRVVTALDYDADGDVDILAAAYDLQNGGLNLFINDGFGNFTNYQNCFLPFVFGVPEFLESSFLDIDNKPDIIISTVDTVYVLFNSGNPLTDVLVEENVMESFSLSQNYPNPFNPATKIQYKVSHNDFLSLKVYDILGKEIATLVNEEKTAGSYEVSFNASQLSSGIYFYKLQAGSFIETKKMILIK